MKRQQWQLMDKSRKSQVEVMKQVKFIFIGFVISILLLISCTNSTIVYKEDKETETKFVYMAKLFVEEDKKLLESIKFILQQNIPIEQPNDCDKYIYDTNAAISKEFFNRTYPKHLEELKKSITSMSNHTVIAFANVGSACIQSRVYRLSGKAEDLEKAYNYKRQISEEVNKADVDLLRIEEFFNTQAGK